MPVNFHATTKTRYSGASQQPNIPELKIPDAFRLQIRALVSVAMPRES